MNPPDLYQKLLNASFRFVSYRPRSRHEVEAFLQKKLRKWKIEGWATLEKVAERLTELGYLDDLKFAQWWIEQRIAHRPKSFRVIKIELQQKGIDQEVIATLLSQAQNLEVTLARQAVKKKLRQWERLPRPMQKKKIYDFLLRRGFSGELIGRLIDELVPSRVQL
jgi:regulatory protein